MVNDSLYFEAKGCRICGCSEFADIVDLGEMVLTGRFPAADEPDPPKAPLNMVRCPDCGLVQLLHSVQVSEMFGENYGYRSGITSTMKDHLSSIVKSLSERVDLQSGDVVLDIGCNDGTTLNFYDGKVVSRVGIDPIADLFRNMYPEDFIVHTGFFHAESFLSVSPKPKAKAITSISMFYDLEDPNSFMADVASVLDEEGIWVLEQSYLPTMLENNSFDTICHEHVEYYALKQIEKLTRDNGLRILDVSLNGINGGSFQIFVCHKNSSHVSNSAAVSVLEEKEKNLGLDSDAPFKIFREHIAKVGEDLRTFIEDEVKKGKKVYVYGASTKGNVLLQYFNLDKKLITACAERSPKKWGSRTPGTSIPIISEDDARKDADYFLVLPWSFREEFIKRESDFLQSGGKFIFPLPEFEVV